MSDVASLEIRVGSREVELAGTRLKGLSSASVGAEKSAQSLVGSFTQLAGKAALLAGAVAGFKKTIEVNREFDKLNAGLLTATGSAEDAKIAFGAIEQFASTTPYSLSETTSAFVKMVNYGLQPSERALRSYGNTASALGKDIIQMVEAVADAQTGEFERLKEFGVKTRQQGDQVTFTFRGVSTTVGKTSKEIQDYLIALGETNFSDAMANRMDTLDGKLSNLGDAWDKTFREIGSSPIGDLIRDGVDTAISALEDLTEAMNSDIATGMSAGLRAFGIEARAAYEIVQGLLRGDSKRIDAAIQLADERQRQLVLDSKQREFDRENTKALEEYGLALDKNADKLAKYEKSGEGRRAAPKKLGKEKQNKSLGEDDLARMYEEELSRIEEAQAQELDDIKQSLLDQEQVMRESYERRRAIVLGTVDDEIEREELLSRLADRERERLNKIQDMKEEARLRERDTLFADYLSEEDKIKQNEERKRQAILESTAITERERADLLIALHERTNRELEDIELNRNEAILQNSAGLMANMAQVSKNFGGEQSGAYKALFAMSKAFSIAQATMSIATGAAKALELGWPAGLAAGLQVAAQGAGLLATITSSNYSGAYDAGGVIPAGRIGLVGERGPEFVRGPAVVTSRQQTVQIMSGQGQASQQMPITLINTPDTRGAYEFARSARGEMVFVNGIRRNAATIRQILGVAA